ncbi:MAG TPA: Lrp/AsnC family transcriptional regulator [Nocardioides sp.]
MTLAEDDFSLIHALQIRPRASWADLGRALGASPAALARRWDDLSRSGAAWVTAYPMVTGDAHYAFVEVGCASADLARVRRELAAWPSVMSVEEASRDYNLVLTVGTSSLEQLSRLLLDQIASLEGVHGVRSHVVGRLHSEGSLWRVGALDPYLATAVADLSPAENRTDGGIDPWDETWGPLVTVLARDGRASAAEIARQVDRPLSTVRRQLGRLLRSDVLRVRCDVAQGLTPYTLTVQWWCQVPTTHVAPAVNRLRAHPRVRQVASIPGPANLQFSTWVRGLGEALRVQEFVEEELAPARVLDSAVVLRTVKRMGWQLGEEGRATGDVVPFSLRPQAAGTGSASR